MTFQCEHAHLCLPKNIGTMCGTGAGSHGIAGVTASVINAAKAMLNCHIRDILTQNGASLTFLPPEDVSQWP